MSPLGLNTIDILAGTLTREELIAFWKNAQQQADAALTRTRELEQEVAVLKATPTGTELEVFKAFFDSTGVVWDEYPGFTGDADEALTHLCVAQAIFQFNAAGTYIGVACDENGGYDARVITTTKTNTKTENGEQHGQTHEDQESKPVQDGYVRSDAAPA